MGKTKIDSIPNNENFIRINCSEFDTYNKIYEHYSFRVPNFRFIPSYKKGLWDGYIRLFNKGRRVLYKGLLISLLKFLENKNEEIEIDDQLIKDFKQKDPDTVFDYLKSIKNELTRTPRDYQIKSILHCCTNLRKIILSPTSSGKSLAIYCTARYYYEKVLNKEDKILVLVPTVGLVNQMEGDFISYEKDNKLKDNIHLIYSGQDKGSDKQIYISTWQSIYKLPKSYFSQFKTVLVDEIHMAEAKSIQSIMEKCINAKYRYGFTGTLKKTVTSKLALQAHFGDVFEATDYKELMEKNFISNMKIYNVIFNYKNIPEIYEPAYKETKDYFEEKKYTLKSQIRNKNIIKIVEKLKGNSLVLFQYTDHGKLLKNIAENSGKFKEVLYIDGSVKAERRNEIREIMEKNNNVILIASFGTTSTGVNITNIHNLFLASPYKSQIKILQSIGRGLRKHKDKDVLKVFDIVDDLRPRKRKRERKNYLLKHWLKRMEIYYAHNFETKIIKITLKRNKNKNIF